MESLNQKINAAREDKYTRGQVVAMTGLNPAENVQKAVHVTSSNEMKVTDVASSSVNDKITVGNDDVLSEAQQVLVYGRKDASPAGLRAMKTDFEGAVFVKNEDITSGADFTLSEAQQVLVYGEVTSGPGAGELHPIHITNAGDVEVEIADFVKGQETSADSFPVVLASDQSTVSVSDVNITSGENDTLETAAQFLMYGRKDSSPTGLSAVKVSSDGSLHVSTVRNGFIKDNEIVNVPASGTGSSTPINLIAQDGFGICASSTNQNDPIELYASNNNVQYYQTNIVSQGGQFYHEIYHPCFNYYLIQQTDTSGNPHFMDVICSKR